MSAVGVDACKGGWIAVVLRDEGKPEAHYLPDIGTLTSAIPDAQSVAIDIPIGLPEAGHRAADAAARALLGPRRSSVFNTPVRAALTAPNYATANAISVELTGSGLSQQSFALGVKILEVDAWLSSAPCPVWEVHPD